MYVMKKMLKIQWQLTCRLFVVLILLQPQPLFYEKVWILCISKNINYTILINYVQTFQTIMCDSA
jgi:hypothetical protein